MTTGIMSGSDSNSQDLKTIYQEICRSHDGIANFRARLLALLPVASGAGIFILMGNQAGEADLFHLLPMGIFGVLVTAGLFIYELRGLQKCRYLIEAAKKLERELAPGSWQFGAFNFRQEEVLHGAVGAAGAALVIYPTVIGSWVFIAGIGFRGSLSTYYPAGIVAVLSAAGFALLGLLIVYLQEKRLDKKKSKLNKGENG